jgi:hypothetical protein
MFDVFCFFYPTYFSPIPGSVTLLRNLHRSGTAQVRFAFIVHQDNATRLS